MKRNAALMAIVSSLMTVTLAAQAFGQQTSELQADPLINKDGEIAIYIGTFLIIIAIAGIVGLVSRRVEHAVFTALGLSLILIALFFLTRQ